MDGFLHFDIGVKEKPQNVHLKLIFCHVLDRFNLCERNDLTCLTRIAFRINLWVFVCFFCHCSFITLTQKTTMRLQIVRFLETFRRALSWIKTEVLFFTCSALNCYSFAHSLLAIQEFPACRIQGFLQFCSVQRAALFPLIVPWLQLNTAWIILLRLFSVVCLRLYILTEKVHDLI